MSDERAPKLSGCAISPDSSSFEPPQPVEATFGERRPARVEVANDGLRVRSADAAERTRAKPSSRTGFRSSVYGSRTCWRPTLRAELKNARPDPDRDLEHAPLLAVGLADEARIGHRELGRGRKPLGVLAKVGERLLERLDLERRDVDQARGRPARALERGEQVVDRREVGVRAR